MARRGKRGVDPVSSRSGDAVAHGRLPSGAADVLYAAWCVLLMGVLLHKRAELCAVQPRPSLRPKAHKRDLNMLGA